MTEFGRIVMARPRAARWRDRQAAWEVRIDGQLRGALRPGQELGHDVSIGQHRVQVGRAAVTVSRAGMFWGSPSLDVEVGPAQTVRVRIDPSGLGVQEQLRTSESALRLTVEGPGGDGVSTSTPMPALPAVRFGYLGPWVRSVVDKPRPLASWQAAVSAVMLIISVSFVVQGLVVVRHLSGRGWFGVIFFALIGVQQIVEWMTVYRIRRRLARRSTIEAGTG